MPPAHDAVHRCSRRDLFRYTAALGLASLLPARLASAEGAAPSAADRFLVLIELDGGNDGLNTLVPVEDDRYYQYRHDQGLAIPKGAALSLSGVADFRLHPSLVRTRALFDAGECSLIAGLGYAQNNRSHFRGIDIWNTGSDRDEVLTSGWLGRIFAGTSGREAWAAEAAVLRRYDSNPVTHGDVRSLSMVGPGPFIELGRSLVDLDPAVVAAAGSSGNVALQRLIEVHQRVQEATTVFGSRLVDPGSGTYRPPDYATEFPDTLLGMQLRGIADMITSGTPVPVHKASLRSFDHHAAQVDGTDPTRGLHADLLAEVDGALGAFRDALVEHGRWDQVLVMTYSEFGRRVRPNASLGTDHGGAGVHLALGGRVAGGILGAYPSLAEGDLYRGDLAATTDFRRAWVAAADFLGLDHGLAFGSGHGFAPLPILV